MKPEENHPIEDFYGIEIYSGDSYFVFGKDVVLATNVKKYLIEEQQLTCYQAI
ncbi:YqaI family protein [Jeotgalibacillus salarius]|uniref:YqaI family protein n=1 Tax=Jeotgalibacillus salarius TaxID=546023 RepID=UPI001FC8DA33|nr:hypothetical protein [Jeotgalibacillus salarius]